MEAILDFIQHRPVVVAATLGIVIYCTLKIIKTARKTINTLSQLEKKPDHYDNGIIYLHFFPRSLCRQQLNMSPFGIKVETWLRLHKIPYKAVETFKMSKSTNQIPYIMLDGEEIADSNKIINFLEKKFNFAENEGLTDEERIVSHCLLRTTEDSLAYTAGAIRYLHKENYYKDFLRLPVPGFVKYLAIKQMKRMVKNKLYTHGIGRKTVPDIMEIAREDLLAISGYLGEKRFLMGDSITKVDCTFFAHMSQVVFVDLDYPHKCLIKEEFSNLLPYMDRVKDALWPDWEQLVIP